MTARCPIEWEILVDYWAGELIPAEEDELEQHLFACAACTAQSARMAGVTEAVRAQIPPLLLPERVVELVARGLRVRENPMLPSERKDVVFPLEVDVLIHRLGGMDLATAEQVDFTLHVESSGRELASIENAPFDRAGGAVLLACQKHYAIFPPDTVAQVHVHDRTGAKRTFRYTILHQFGG
jgi:hypothetical protein